MQPRRRAQGVWSRAEFREMRLADSEARQGRSCAAPARAGGPDGRGEARLASPRPAAAAQISCPVCLGPHGRLFCRADARDYWRCADCGARFLDPAQRPAADVERAHYRTHDNRTDDPRYRAFLGRLARPLLERLPARQTGLDFGCGPGPALAALLREAGHRMALYDPVFFHDEAALARAYDFVTCTEAAEHFHRPSREFARLDALVRPGGWLAVMTGFAPADADFARWHYRRDPTHVVFYGRETLEWLAARHGWDCQFPCSDVALMRKRGG